MEKSSVQTAIADIHQDCPTINKKLLSQIKIFDIEQSDNDEIEEVLMRHGYKE